MNFHNYEVYKDGRIYSYLSNKFLKPDVIKSGYQQVTLRIDNKSKKFKVHRLVAYCYCNPPINYKDLQVNHIDGNKLNNNYKNLEWVTAYENNKHARENNLNNISLSNKLRWQNDLFRKQTSEKISKTQKEKQVFAKQNNPRYRYKIVYHGKNLILNELSKILNISYSKCYNELRKYLNSEPNIYDKMECLEIIDLSKGR